MRLLYVIDSLAPGGAERSLALLAPRYRDLGVEVHVAYLRERDGLRAELSAAGATVTTFPGKDGRLRWIRELRRLVRDRGPDLVHTTLFESDVTGRVAARLAAVPVVSSLVNVEYGPDHVNNPALSPWKVRGAHVADAVTARLAVRLHAVSAHVADTMAARLRFDRARVDVVPRGRDAQRLGQPSVSRRSAARDALGLENDLPVILAVARQDHGKGLDVLLRAVVDVRRDAPGARVVVAGRPGDQTAVLQRLVAEHELGDTIQFVGARDDVADLLCAADVFVLPSRREGMPGALLEAMALETPIVASDLAQVREVVDEACARLVPPDSPGELARAVCEVLGAPDLAEQRTERASARFADRFTIERVAEQMVAFYERALAD